MSGFVNLHVHSSKGSLLDSILKVSQIAEYAARNHQPAIALSDHGTMHGSLDLVNACRKNGVKPITACEIYECDNHLEQNAGDKYNHLLLIARTTNGLKNLYQIVTEGYRNGFYKKPRVSINWIKDNKLGDGIICLTACQAGRISRELEQGRTENAKEFMDLLDSTFDYVCVELQSHKTQSQWESNVRCVEFAKKFSYNWVITSDAHMERADQIEAHSIFVEISQDREIGETYEGCHLQTENDVYEYLNGNLSSKDIEKGIAETLHIADMVEDIDYELNKGTVMPQAHIPLGYTLSEYFREMVYSTFDKKFGHMPQEEQRIRKERIEFEIPVLEELDFLNYLLIQREFCVECNNRGIPRGYSRGSAANCLCAFMLDITQIDSVRWDLDFSRFANIGRKGTAADVDIDIAKSRRQDAIQVLCDIFGADHVAPMATFNTLSTKVAIRDIGKVLNNRTNSPYYNQIPYSIRDEVSRMIPTIKTLNDLGEEEEKDILLKELLGSSPRLDAIYKQFPLWFKYVMELEGLEKSRGRHASGTLVTPKPVLFYTPLCLDNEHNLMSMFDMHICQDDKGGMGLVKEDLLGLETLDVLDLALKNAQLTWQDVDINNLDFEDKEVYNRIYKTGNTVNVFQMESFDARKMLITAKADNIEDIILVNAANRPGTKDSFPDYCKNKLEPNSADVIHEDLRKLFSQTKSVLMYQEQALSLLRYANFPEVEVEVGRRAIGKKKAEDMAKLKPKFTDGLKLHSWTDKQIEDIWELLLKQSTYCFNRGHAVAYGLLSYLCAYMKVHYPIEFQTAALTVKTGDPTKIGIIINDCENMGIKVLPPNINKSGIDFTSNNGNILFGLSAISGIGRDLAEQLVACRNSKYTSLNNLLETVPLNKGQVISLIKSGAIPCKNKGAMLKKYIDTFYNPLEYKPLTKTPSYNDLVIKYNIDIEKYRIGTKKYDYDKVSLLQVANEIKKRNYETDEQKRYEKYLLDNNKYFDDEYLWEFNALNFFVTNNPFKESSKYIEKTMGQVSVGQDAVVAGTISKIQRKKDKNKKPYAFVWLCSDAGLIEITLWSKQFAKYEEYITKGNSIVVKGIKTDGSSLKVDQIKPYKTWLEHKIATHKS